MDMRGKLPYRDGYTSRPFKAGSDDVLFGVPIITIYLPCMRYRSLHNLSYIRYLVSKNIEFTEKTLDYMESRINNKLDMLGILLKGHAVCWWPEGTWNLSPNKLHLPMSYGFLEVAQKAGVPVIPMVVEYTYDTTMPKERITKAHIRYGKPITVGLLDSLKEKLHEYEEAVSTMRWELMEEKGLYQRKDISDLDYVNFIKGNLVTLELGQVSLESERKAMRGANDEFYVFHHINDIPWDVWGELLQTDEVERLRKINRVHGI